MTRRWLLPTMLELCFRLTVYHLSYCQPKISFFDTLKTPERVFLNFSAFVSVSLSKNKTKTKQNKPKQTNKQIILPKIKSYWKVKYFDSCRSGAADHHVYHHTQQWRPVVRDKRPMGHISHLSNIFSEGFCSTSF